MSDPGPKLKSKQDLHLARKIWHCLGLLLMTAVYLSTGPVKSGYIIGGAVLFGLPFDLIRQRNQALNAIVMRLFAPVMRSYEANHITGLTNLVIGCGIMMVLFGAKTHVIVLTLLFHGFGDPIASYFGIKYGQDKILRNKSLQGTMAAFVTCTVISGVYYYMQNIMAERLFIVAPLSGMIGAASELIPIYKLDDNLTFPIVCSVLLWVLFTVYGGFA